MALAGRAELDTTGWNGGVDGYGWMVTGWKGRLGGLEVPAGGRDLVDGGFVVTGCHSGLDPLPR